MWIPMAEPVQLSFRRPMDEQVAAFRLRLRNLQPTVRWDDLAGQAHDSAGMVAGAVKGDLIAAILGAVDRYNVEGTGLETFRKDFRAIVEQQGWHGWTGEGTAKGEAWRTRVIWKTNISTSYAAGRWAQLHARKFKYLVYRHSGAEHPRLDHLSWDGLVLEIDHPFWKTHFPPNGWGCGCKVRGAMSLELAERLGGNLAKKLPSDWAMIDPRTGVQKGIGKGWDHAPGATVANTISAMVEKPVRWQYNSAKAFMAEVPEENRDALATAYRALPSVATDMRRYVERVTGMRNGAPIAEKVQVEPLRTLGLLTSAEIRAAKELTGFEPTGFDYTVDQDAVRHVMASHGNAEAEQLRGQRAVVPQDFARLGQLLLDPDEVTAADSGADATPRLRYEKQFGAERIVAIFELRRGRGRLALVTMWVEKRADAPPSSTP